MSGDQKVGRRKIMPNLMLCKCCIRRIPFSIPEGGDIEQERCGIEMLCAIFCALTPYLLPPVLPTILYHTPSTNEMSCLQSAALVVVLLLETFFLLLNFRFLPNSCAPIVYRRKQLIIDKYTPLNVWHNAILGIGLPSLSALQSLFESRIVCFCLTFCVE